MKNKINQEDIKQMSFEKALEELEIITNDYEDGNPSIEKAVKLYERGLALTEHCENKLQEAKKKIEEIKITKKKIFSNNEEMP
tara:strand:- start:2307 stop:2555 length:249 start_codon:yes stop_codon:yes gene_type:complete